MGEQEDQAADDAALGRVIRRIIPATLEWARRNPWLLLVLGFAGGGGSGTLMEKVNGPKITVDTVRVVVREAMREQVVPLAAKVAAVEIRQHAHEAGDSVKHAEVDRRLRELWRARGLARSGPETLGPRMP
jgi:hypothetical protein